MKQQEWTVVTAFATPVSVFIPSLAPPPHFFFLSKFHWSKNKIAIDLLMLPTTQLVPSCERKAEAKLMEPKEIVVGPSIVAHIIHYCYCNMMST
jgi:hypothetical protein